MSEIRKHIVFHGRVQGVGFRYMAMHYASSLGLTGGKMSMTEPSPWKCRAEKR